MPYVLVPRSVFFLRNADFFFLLAQSCGTNPSHHPRKRRSFGTKCPIGWQRCAHLSGIGGEDCIDIRNDLESCGGCINLGDREVSPADGEDCTALSNVNVVGCKRGRCVIGQSFQCPAICLGSTDFWSFNRELQERIHEECRRHDLLVHATRSARPHLSPYAFESPSVTSHAYYMSSC